MSDIDELIYDVAEAGSDLGKADERGSGIDMAQKWLAETKATLRTEVARLQDKNEELDNQLTGAEEALALMTNKLADDALQAEVTRLTAALAAMTSECDALAEEHLPIDSHPKKGGEK